MSNAHGPAYPVNSSSYPAQHRVSGAHYDYTVHETTGGLTKRELIAAMAMQGLAPAVCADAEGLGRPFNEREVCAQAVALADALLAELERRDD